MRERERERLVTRLPASVSDTVAQPAMSRLALKSVGLDTSFVLRLLTGEPTDQAAAAVAWLNALRSSGKQAVVSDPVAGETYFALHYHYGVPKQLALDKLREFFESPEIAATGEALAVLREPGLGKARPGFVDRLIHAGYLKEASGMLTFEKAAGKFPRVVIPK